VHRDAYRARFRAVICYGAREFGGSALVTRRIDRRLGRLALIGPLAAALALAACGRKGPLDAPPSAAVVQPTPGEPGVGEAPTEPFGSGFLRAPQPEPAPPAGTPQPPPKKSFLLDWLL
jgi:predicted small lipoprotein YifL